jgi:hypothetical protein
MERYALLALLLAGPLARAQTIYPTILGAHPAGVQRGKTTDILVYGYRYQLTEAYKLLFDGDSRDFQTTILSDGKKGPLSVRLTVAPDARPGIREFRVATARGVSSVATLVVGDEPGVLEVEPNDTPDKAQAVSIPVTIYGRLDRAEDIDWYRFRVEAGDEISFAVLSSRLQFKLYFARHFIDPMLILTDDKGQELATNDDYFGADPFLRYRFANAGEYRIGIRDYQSRGEMPSPYELRITRQPFLLNVYPLAVERGQEVELRPTRAGDPPRPLPPVKVRIPGDWQPGRHELVLTTGGQPSNAVPILVADLPGSQKQEAGKTPEKAHLLPVNSGINGWLAASGDVDWYRFSARKGETYVLEVFARRYQSDLDSVVSIHDATGKQLAVNDDAVLDMIPNPNYSITRTNDSRIVWTAPADGDYRIRLTDVHGNGGPSFVYFLSCRVAQPDFVLRCDPDDKANIGPGCSTTWHLHLERLHGFDTPVRVEVQGLPEGVSASRLVLSGKRNQGCLVLTASPDANVNAAIVRVIGVATVKDAAGRETSIVRECRPIQEIYHFGGRELCMVRTHTVAVTNTATLVITPGATEARLTPGGSVRIDFEVKRGADFPADATLAFGHLLFGIGGGRLGADPFPPGITVDQGKSKLRLGPKESKGWAVVTAAPTVEPITEVPFSLIAIAGTDSRLLVTYSTPAIYLSVSPTAK